MATSFPGVVLEPDAARRLRNAGQKSAEWTTERDRLIREALAAGGTLREIGELVGLSHTAVKMIGSRKGKP
jgi:DNA-binding NarL/FixJ family response regulator